MTEEIQRRLQMVQKDYSELHARYGDVSSRPCTLDIGQENGGVYLSTQLVDLLLLVNVETPEELMNYIKECGQFPTGLDIGEVSYENLEEKKREVFRAYQESYISYKELAKLENPKYEASRILFDRVGIPQESMPMVQQFLSKRDYVGISNFIGNLDNGEEIVRRINHCIVRDYENIQGVTYEQVIGLDALIKRDPTIDTIVGMSAKYDMSMKTAVDGKRAFDPYYLDRVLKYCKLTDKHMRFHSLFDRTTAEDFKRVGLTRDEVLTELKNFSDGYFDYLTTHDETLKDGSRLINCAEIFNELLTFYPGVGDGKDNAKEVWLDYFDIDMDTLLSFVTVNNEGTLESRVPSGVDVMYNETMLEEGPNRIEAIRRVIAKIEYLYPGFVNVFGNQLHLYDSIIIQDGGIQRFEGSIDLLKEINNKYGINVEITEHDLNIDSNFVEQCAKYGVDPEYIRLKKIDYQARISWLLKMSGLDVGRVSYWSIFDQVDHNLVRCTENKIKEGNDITEIDSLHAGLLPDGMDIGQVESLNPESPALSKEMNKPKTLKFEMQNNGGNRGSLMPTVVLVAILLVLVVLIVLSMKLVF